MISNQSGKIILVLMVLLFLAVSCFFLYKGKNSLIIDKNVGFVGVKPSFLDTNLRVLKGLGIEAQLPNNSELEEFSASSFDVMRGISGDRAYRFYFNENANVIGSDKEYSGLTMFFISYPNKSKMPLNEFLPKIIQNEQNIVSIEDSKVGTFDGFKYTQCCYSGGIEEFYFLNENESLILIKAYNRGPDHDFYNRELSRIIGSIRPMVLDFE